MWGDVWGQPWAIWQPFAVAPEPPPSLVLTSRGTVVVGAHAHAVRVPSTSVGLAAGSSAHMVRVADASATVAVGAHAAKVVISG